MIVDFGRLARVAVPRATIARTEDVLRTAGVRNAEAIVLWAGRRDYDVFRVVEAYVPAQAARPAEHGACVIVEGRALFAFNAWLWEHRFEFIAQVHSHPEEAFLSETDIAYPIATRVGNFSIVVPHFGRDAFAFEAVGVYRYDADGAWRELARADVCATFTIEERH